MKPLILVMITNICVSAGFHTPGRVTIPILQIRENENGDSAETKLGPSHSNYGLLNSITFGYLGNHRILKQLTRIHF